MLSTEVLKQQSSTARVGRAAGGSIPYGSVRPELTKRPHCKVDAEDRCTFSQRWRGQGCETCRGEEYQCQPKGPSDFLLFVTGAVPHRTEMLITQLKVPRYTVHTPSPGTKWMDLVRRVRRASQVWPQRESAHATSTSKQHNHPGPCPFPTRLGLSPNFVPCPLPHGSTEHSTETQSFEGVSWLRTGMSVQRACQL